MRRTGITAMIRLKDEAEWVEESLTSILGQFDEYVIAIQPSTDRTEEIVHDVIGPWAQIYKYPHDSWPNGEGYYLQDPTSVYSRTYFYNWTLAHTTCQYICKWDGDLIAMDWLGEELHMQIDNYGYDQVSFFGIDLAGDLGHCSINKKCPTDGAVRWYPGLQYVNGAYSERLNINAQSRMYIGKPAFLHTKWLKSEESITKAWPKDWRDSSHFVEIMKRRTPGDEYKGEYPPVLRYARP